MLVREITYVDHDGETVTQKFHFNLTKAEAIQINLMEDLEAVKAQRKNPRAVIPVMNRVIQFSFGVKLPNGNFTKEESQTSWFLASDAYSELFLWLLSDEDGTEPEQKFADFINAVLGIQDGQLPTRAVPQDHKKKEQDEMPLQNLPSDAHRVDPGRFSEAEIPAEKEPNGLANNEEFQQWLVWKREQDAIKTENSVIPSSPHQSNAD